MVTFINADSETLMKQAPWTAKTYLRQAVEDIDDVLGKGAKPTRNSSASTSKPAHSISEQPSSHAPSKRPEKLSAAGYKPQTRIAT